MSGMRPGASGSAGRAAHRRARSRSRSRLPAVHSGALTLHNRQLSRPRPTVAHAAGPRCTAACALSCRPLDARPRRAGFGSAVEDRRVAQMPLPDPRRPLTRRAAAVRGLLRVRASLVRSLALSLAIAARARAWPRACLRRSIAPAAHRLRSASAASPRWWGRSSLPALFSGRSASR